MNNINRRIKHETVDFLIPSNGSNLTVRHTFFPGIILAAAIHLNGELPSQLVNCGIKAGGGDTIIEPTTIRDWQQRQGGDYIDSMKPLYIKGGSQLIIEFNSSANLTGALSGQIVFLVKEPSQNIDSDLC